MKIIVRNDQGVAEEVALSSDKALAVGRQPDVNDLVINDIKASRKHGQFVLEDDTVYFEDLGSGNGTLFKDEKLEANKRIPLAPGEEVRIGETRLVVDAGEVEAAAEAPAAGSGESEVPDDKTGVLEGLDGDLAGKTFGLGDRPLFLGRIPACHIQINDGLASRRNTEVSRTGAVYCIKDLGSSNGTFVNEEKITEGTLCDGDVVRVGEKRLRFSIVDREGAPAVPVPKTISEPATPTPGAPVPAPAPSLIVPAVIATAVIGVLILGLGVYFIFLRGGSGNGKPPVPGPNGGGGGTVTDKTYPVMLGKPVTIDMPQTLQKTANVYAAQRDNVPFRVGLKVEKVHVKNQQRVKKGDPLVTFEMQESLRTAKTQAKAAVESAKASVGKAEDGVRKADRAVRLGEENLKIAQEAYDKNKTLYDGGNLLQTEWDKIRKTRNDARANVDIRKEEKSQAARTVKQAQEKVKQALADLNKVQSNMDDLTVEAKIGGIVTDLDLKRGYTITPANQSMAIIEYEKEVKVIAPIPEDDISLVKKGMKVEVWLPRAPQEVFSGTVALIPATARQRNYDVEVMVANENQHFRPGAQAMVKFIVALHKGVLAVPSAVIGSGKRGGFFVYVYDSSSNKARSVSVKRGVEAIHEGRTHVQLLPDPNALQKVNPSDLIVFDGHRNLQDNVRVEVKNRAEMGLK